MIPKSGSRFSEKIMLKKDTIPNGTDFGKSPGTAVMFDEAQVLTGERTIS
jgi:hypothetical protein